MIKLSYDTRPGSTFTAGNSTNGGSRTVRTIDSNDSQTLLCDPNSNAAGCREQAPHSGIPITASSSQKSSSRDPPTAGATHKAASGVPATAVVSQQLSSGMLPPTGERQKLPSGAPPTAGVSQQLSSGMLHPAGERQKLPSGAPPTAGVSHKTSGGIPIAADKKIASRGQRQALSSGVLATARESEKSSKPSARLTASTPTSKGR